MDKCEVCNKKISFGGIQYVGMDKTELLCSDCFNGRVAESWEIEKPFADFEPIILKDTDGKSHKFGIITMLSCGLELKDKFPWLEYIED